MFSCCFYLFLLPLPLYLKLFTCNDNAFKYIQIVRSLREAKLGYLLVPKYHYVYVRNNGLTPPLPHCTQMYASIIPPPPPSPCVRTKWMPPNYFEFVYHNNTIVHAVYLVLMKIRDVTNRNGSLKINKLNKFTNVKLLE